MSTPCTSATTNLNHQSSIIKHPIKLNHPKLKCVKNEATLASEMFLGFTEGEIYKRVSHNLPSYAKTSVINSHISQETFPEINAPDHSCNTAVPK